MNQRRDGWRGTAAAYGPLAIWVGVIFFLSSSQGSMARTSLFVRPLLEFLFPTADEATLQIYHGYIRKSAHVTEYAVLAILASRAFLTSSKSLLKNHWWTAAIMLTVTVAATDEFNQSFNPARTGTPWDVVIDITGGLLGMACFKILHSFLD